MINDEDNDMEPTAADIDEYEELLFEYGMDERLRDDDRACQINYADAWLSREI